MKDARHQDDAGSDPREGARPPLPKQTQPHPGEEAHMRPRPDYGEKTYRGYGRLREKVALVTGGDSGIGRAVALAFAREGADVAISYSYLPEEQRDADETRRVVEAAERHALLLPGDLAEVAYCRQLVEQTVERFGRIDVLVNNAAFQGKAAGGIGELDAERIERTFRVNVMAMFHVVREAVAHMHPGSSIINVSSVQAYSPKPPILDYAATNGAVVTFTKGLALELAARGIRVNCVAPGPVWTPLIPQSFGEEKVEQHGASAPLGRPAQPAEVAPAFVFLASDESRFVVGEVLGVTGGMVLP